MKEIEVKFRVSDMATVVEKLVAQGCVFSSALEQRDLIFIPQEETMVPVTLGANVLRLRTQGAKTLFTLKRSDPENHLSKHEWELEVGSAEKMREIIAELGFKKAASVNKIRRSCKIRDMEICLDEVEGLGSFLEVEKITDRDPAAAQKEMLEFVESLGVDVSGQVFLGYDVLMAQANHAGN